MDFKQRCLSAAVSAAVLAGCIGTAQADALPAVSIGAGVQTSFYSCDKGCIYSPGTVHAGESSVNGFALDSIRLYVNGSVTDQIKFTFNTEYTGGPNTVEVMDAIGRFEFNDYVNIWAGRFLPPSDRANLYGPYYANDWAPYADGVADNYPNVAVGRDNGLAYWGDFGPVKVQLGLFDGESLGGSAVANHSALTYAGRVTVDLWDKEKGYYFNGTYYGDKDLLAIGFAAQSQNGKNAYGPDLLVEKNLPGIGVFGVEAEYQEDKGLNANAVNAATHGWYVLSDYLFPQVIGWGKVQVLGKFSQKSFDASPTPGSGSRFQTDEFNLNYIIKEFSARVGFYYLHQTTPLSPKEFGIKLQLQM